ncbi:glycosyltransferase [Microbacterium sp.]|uniref:glycosyltransferase n=1 Tax=Microbacterium sp. TaxID=51671 RepID=UPI0028122E0C|nr:glycosyltransferase [Microbacterium sp.]
MGVRAEIDAASGTFPEAAYLVLSSRLVPDLDGGYTIATLARARQMAERGADVQLLTLDPADAVTHAAHRAEFTRRGMLPAGLPLRNLFDEAVAPAGGAAEWLRRTAASARPVHGISPNARDTDAGKPFGGRQAVHSAPAAHYRELTDAEGRAFLSLPVITGDPDWHLSTAPVRVHGADGAEVGTLPGFGGLYLAWLRHVVAVSDGPVVLICESRQLGELIAGWSDPRVRILHTIHTMHLEPPYTPDAPLNPLWTRWLGIADRFDAVLWPTRAQRDDVVARFGDGARHLVAPNGIDLPTATDDGAREDGAREDSAREPGLVVSMARLAPGKRIDHSIRAFLAADVDGAVLEIWGDGPDRDRLAALLAETDAADRVRLMGATDDPAAVLRRATVMVTSTAFEGQGLSIVEALATGCPVISYDVRYGPGDILRGGGGVLVPSGDEQALAAALRAVLTDHELRGRLAREARTAASVWSADAAMTALAYAARMALAAPPRR